MKKITIEWLKGKSACNNGMRWLKAKGNPELPYEELVTLCIKEDHFDYANWLIVQIMNKKQKVKYAVFAAQQVLDIFEKEYPTDGRPRKAIEAAEAYIKNPCKRTKNDVAYAARAAATDAASDAAVYAAHAARAAVYAARAAAATDDASVAAYAASVARAAIYVAKKDLQNKIINNGLKILKARINGLDIEEISVLKTKEV